MNEALRLEIKNSELIFSNSELGTDRAISISSLIDNKHLSNIPDSIEFISESPGVMRVLGKGREVLRLTFEGIKQFENACPREDGGLDVSLVRLGKILISPKRGAMWHNAMWVPAKAQCNDFIVDLLPSQETGEFECVIYTYYSNLALDGKNR